MDIKRLFGENLKYYRKKSGYTQEILAEKLGISINHLANLEIGKKFVSANLLQKISKTINVSFSALFYDPKQKVIDDSYLGRIDSILNEHLAMAKKKIRDLQ